MGSWWPLKPKVKAAIVTAILTYLATRFGLNLGEQQANLINAAAPLIVAYFWDERWDAKPQRKLWVAFLFAVATFALFKFGIESNKFVEAALNAVIPIVVAYFVPNPSNSEETPEAE